MKKVNCLINKTLIYLSLIVLISSCKKDETNSTVTPQGGTGELVEANVTASFDYTSNSIPNKQFGSNMTYESIADSVIDLGDGNFMKAELLVEDGIVSESISSDNINPSNSVTNNSLRAARISFPSLTTYKVFIFTKNPNKLVDERNYVAGKESETPPLSFIKGVQYKVVGISLENRQNLDDYVVRKGERLEDFTFKLKNNNNMAQRNMLFFSNDVYIDPSAPSFELNLNFKPYSSQVTTVIEVPNPTAGVVINTADVSLNVRGHKGAEKPFWNNEIIRVNNQKHTLAMPTFTGLGTSPSVSSTTIVNTANPKGSGDFFVTLNSVKIGTKTYSNINYFKDQEILPSKRYTLKISLADEPPLPPEYGDDNGIPTVRIGNQVWMRHNLQPNGGYKTNAVPNTPADVRKLHSFYYQWSVIPPVEEYNAMEGRIGHNKWGNRGDQFWNRNSGGGKGLKDPCPVNFRVPDSKDYAILFRNTKASDFGNVSSSATNFSGGTMLTSTAKASVKIFFPNQGYFSNLLAHYNPTKGVQARGSEARYLIAEHYINNYIPLIRYVDIRNGDTEKYFSIRSASSTGGTQFNSVNSHAPVKCIKYTNF